MQRIFKQLGQGYGASSAHITAQIDGNTVFSGPVSTVDQTVPGYEPGVNLGVECYDWTEPVANYTGTRSFSISVRDGWFQTGATLAQGNLLDPTAYWSPSNADPLTNVHINGQPVTRGEEPPGQWGWTLHTGDTLTATLNIEGIVIPELPPPGAPGNTAGNTEPTP